MTRPAYAKPHAVKRQALMLSLALLVTLVVVQQFKFWTAMDEVLLPARHQSSVSQHFSPVGARQADRVQVQTSADRGETVANEPVQQRWVF